MHIKPLVLVVEDDLDISELIEFNLSKNGFDVAVAHDGVEAINFLQNNDSDKVLRAIILDVMMPGADGLSVLKNIRLANSRHRNVPVMMLTAKSEESDIVVGLEIGADDYLTKPFSPKELVARVRALLRRSELPTENAAVVSQTSETKADLVNVGPLRIDLARHEVYLNGETLVLTLAEFKLLHTLTSKPGRVFTRDQLLEKVSGTDTYVIDRNVDVHIRAIRKKLHTFADFIQTVRGVGYKCREL